ncbi:class III lanthionine synthetase LanKC [Streptomyces sp. NPDC046261]|uniref:class III lanthionine synthetase LanKC n=1 Tax=Streptomyces sp. NPDC046261 TaxID=3157200 RepID=UPI00340441AE
MLTLRDYDRFALADPVFYDTPERYPDDHDRLAAARRTPPQGWQRAESGWWITLRPPGSEPPAQGWQIHVSVTPERLARAVDIVWGHCVRARLAFDFVRSPATARESLGHRAERLPDRHLVTLHAGDEATLTRTLGVLAPLLDGLAGPYLLGALRHGPGPLHARYAAPAGGPLERPDGTLVPAPRRAVFTLPEWVPLPEVLRADRQALHAPPAGHFPYRAERALGLKHGGGTYLATDIRTGDRVVLREARPHAGLDRRGEDAVARLGRRRATLARLAGLGCVPRPAGHLTRGEHHFLAEEYVEGTCLRRAASAAFPLTSAERAEREAGSYTAWALGVLESVGQALDAVHDRGLRLGELRPQDVLVRPGSRAVLVGLTSATHPGEDRPPPVGDGDFAVPAGLTGRDAARYLLERLRLWLFLPLPCPGPRKLRTLAAAVEAHYPVPAGFTARLLAGLSPAGPPREDRAGALLAAPSPDWPTIRDSLVRGIHSSATPGRRDRLFPGTPSGPADIGGAAFGYGAAGVLYALHRAGAHVPRAYTDWLTEAARRDGNRRPGLYDGLHGVAFTLDVLGHRAQALEVLDLCPASWDRSAAADLAGGRAGIALTLLHFAAATGRAALRERALRLASELGRAVDDGPLPALPGRPPPYGLLHGATGVALLFLRLGQETGEASWLDLADRALRHDLGRLRTLEDGTVTLFDGTTGLPYLHGGSAGVALVLHEVLRHRPDPGRAAVLDGIRRTCDGVYVHNAGLLRGRAGAIATLAAVGGPADRPAVLRQVRRLAWHARSHEGELAFPGFRMLRLSSDLATGAAGVLLALDYAFGGTGGIGGIGAKGPVLPFLGSRSPAVPSAPEGR